MKIFLCLFSQLENRHEGGTSSVLVVANIYIYGIGIRRWISNAIVRMWVIRRQINTLHEIIIPVHKFSVRTALFTIRAANFCVELHIRKTWLNGRVLQKTGLPLLSVTLTVDGSKAPPNRKWHMGYQKVSNGHVNDDVTSPWKVKLVTPIRLERNISKTARDRDSVSKDYQ